MCLTIGAPQKTLIFHLEQMENKLILGVPIRKQFTINLYKYVPKLKCFHGHL